MNREDEYLSLLQELEHTPADLEYTITRALARIKSEKRKRLTLGFFGSVATFMLAFIILVNFSLGFAQACGRIPLIKELAQLVAFSPSLSTAVENEYVQPIELEQTKNEITARVEYVIVDQKRLEIFYSLDSKKYSAMDATPEIKAANEEALEGYSIHSSRFNKPNGELRQATVDFVEKNMPPSLQLILKVHDNSSLLEMEPMPAIPVEDSLLNTNNRHVEPDYITQFTFTLEFDPNYTVQGKTIALNQTFHLDGQTLTATTVEIYPTHLRLNLKDHEGNTAWLKSLAFYLENEKGQRFESVSSGITATGSIDSPMMDSYRLESPFFYESKQLTIFITGTTWLDKNMEKIHLDLKNQTIEALPQNVALENVEQKNGSWLLTFSAEQFKKNSSHQLWNWSYYDKDGKEYHINSVSSITGEYFNEKMGQFIDDPERFIESFALNNYPHDEVYLCPAYSRVVKLSSPIEIKVK